MRLFIAFLVPKKIREYVLALQSYLRKKAGLRNIKWVEKENIHLTLAFLGKVDEKKLKEIVFAVKEGISETGGINLETTTLGFFPDKNYPRIIWLGLKGDLEEIYKEHRGVIAELNKIGFFPDPRFEAHITLGRIKKRTHNLVEKTESLADFLKEKEKFSIKKIALIESKLSSRGPTYKIVKEFTI